MAIDTFIASLNQFSSFYSILLTALVLFTALIYLTTAPSPDPREPPTLKPKIPIIGHLLGLIIHQASYLQTLSKRTTSPITTLRILTGRIYVIKSPSLVQAIYKNPRSFSFDTIFIDASRRIFGMSDAQMNILQARPPTADPLDGYPLAKETQKVMHATMASGSSLREMNVAALSTFANSLHAIDNSQVKRVNLYSWVFTEFTKATAAAIYGPANPIAKDESLIDALQDFEEGIGALYMDFLPQYTAKKAWEAREKFKRAFGRYYASGGDERSAAIVRGRKRVLVGGGYGVGDLAGFDVGILVAGTMNSNPAVFWLLMYIFSDPVLLAAIRAEVENITRFEGAGMKKAVLDIAKLNGECPLLLSSWQETLRMTNAPVSTRTVTQDTMLADQYLLKKGGVVQMACGPMHTDPSIWGEDSTTFNAARFIKFNEDHLEKGVKKLRKSAFVPFGGGTVLCPGRYFASTEVLGVVACLVVGFDIEGSEGGVGLRVPEMKKQAMSVQVKQPEKDVEVLIRRRKEWRGVMWSFDVGADADADKQDSFLG